MISSEIKVVLGGYNNLMEDFKKKKPEILIMSVKIIYFDFVRRFFFLCV